MPEHSENRTLTDYVEQRSDQAFSRLVALHIDMVFGCAIRRSGDRELAEEISQNVFTILARKAHKLKAGSGLAGWLHKTTLYETKKALRGESRRNRKMKALAEHALTQDQNRTGRDSADSDVLPLVDEAIDELPDTDRRLLLMRFFEGKNFREIAAATGKSEAASQKQASRAIEKLGRVLKRRGVVASTTALGTMLASESAKAAPTGIINAISSGAVAGASTLSGSTLITNAIQSMTYAKTKIAIIAAATAAVPIGAQWKTIDSLKQEAEIHKEREVKFVQQGERLSKLEQQIESLPEGLLASYAQNAGNGKSQGKQTQSQQRKVTEPGKLTGIKNKLNALKKLPSELDVGTEEETEADPMKSVLSGYADMMDNPAMRAMVKRQMITQLEVSHGDFIREVTDDEDKQAQIKQLLLDQMMGLSEAGMEMSENLTEDGALNIENIVIETDRYDEQFKELMGEEGWEEFQRFEASAPERQELSTFREILEESGQELTFETEQQLMAVMYETRSNYDHTSILDPNEPVPESLNITSSPEGMNRYYENQQALQVEIRDRVSSILSPAQLKTFEQNQNNQIDMMRGAVEMSAQFLNRREAAE